MATWYCANCGNEFDASPFSEEEVCPICNNTLYNDPQLCRNILQDAGYEV